MWFVERVAAAAAATGGVFWTVKSASILVADFEPEYVFAMGPACFGVASIGVARIRKKRRMTIVALLAATAGVLASVAYLVQGDEAPFGIFAMVAMLSVLAVLLGCGRAIWRSEALGRWSFAPWVLGWVTIAAIPVGGALAEVDERLLEVPLLVVGLGWIGLGVVMASPHRVRGSKTTVAVPE